MNIVILKRRKSRQIDSFRCRTSRLGRRLLLGAMAVLSALVVSGCAVSGLYQSNEGLVATFERANTAYAAGRFGEARKAYKTALESVPDNVLILRRLGNISYYLGNYTDARDYYQRALAEQPKQPSLYFNLAMVDLTTARESLKHYMRLSDGNLMAIMDLMADIDDFADKSATITQEEDGDEALSTGDSIGIQRVKP